MAAMATLCSEALRLQEQLAREANWLDSIMAAQGGVFGGWSRLNQVEIGENCDNLHLPTSAFPGFLGLPGSIKNFNAA